MFFGSLIGYVFYSDTSFALDHLAQIIYSQATKDAVDIGARASFIYKIVMFGGVISASIWYMLDRFISSNANVASEVIKKVAYLSFVGLITLYCHISHTDCISSIGVILLIIFFYLIQILPLGSRFDEFYSIVNNDNGAEKILLSAFLVTYQLKFFGISPQILKLHFVVLFFIVLAVLLLATIFLYLRWSKHDYRFSIITLCGASFLNIFLFEIYSNTFYTLPHYYYALIYFALVGCFIFLYLIMQKMSWLLLRFYQISSLHLLSFTILIVILISALYAPFGVQIADTFELANPAIPHMRIVKDSQIPLIDFMSSHMISEQFYGYIYHLFFGYDGDLDFHTYSFLYEFLFYVLVYLFLNKLFRNPILALIFVIFFPYTKYLFGRDYFWCIIGFYMLYRLILKQSVSTYLSWFFIVGLLICWRLDTGAAFLIASPIFLVLAFISSDLKFQFVPFAKAFAIFIVIVSCAIFVAVQLRSIDFILDNFENALSYITSNQAHGTSAQSQNYNHLFYVIHVLLPFVAFVSILTSVYSLSSKKIDAQKSFLLLCSLFLYLVFFANFQRGVVRHNFLMEYDHMLTSTFYLAFILQMLAYSPKYLSSEFRFYALFGGGFLLIIMIKVFHLKSKIPLHNSLESIFMVRESNNFLFSQKKGIKKDIVFSSNYYEKIKQFMNENLSKNQTFLDFSNNPMLYYYCQRSVPSYFCQSLQNTVTDFQQLSQIKELDTSLVPMVVYQNIPRGWGDQTDEVPNNMRQYLIAEFIYQHYEPYSIINDKAIWITKGLKSSLDSTSSSVTDTSYMIPLDIDYKNSAYLVGEYYASNQVGYLLSIGTVKAIFQQEYGFNSIAIPDNVRNTHSVYAKITFDQSVDNRQIKVHEGKEDWGRIGSFSFLTRPSSSSYMLRLTNHYLWHKEGCFILIMEGLPKGVGCQIEFLKDTRI